MPDDIGVGAGGPENGGVRYLVMVEEEREDENGGARLMMVGDEREE